MPPNSSIDLVGRFVGAAIAPAVLFTACSLLLSGLQGKYSTLVASMRTLNREKRDLPETAARRLNIEKQLIELYQRTRLIRNSLFCLYLAIMLLLLASLCAGCAALGSVFASHVGLLLFGGGMGCMVTAMGIGFLEARRAFAVVMLELEDFELDEAESEEGDA